MKNRRRLTRRQKWAMALGAAVAVGALSAPALAQDYTIDPSHHHHHLHNHHHHVVHAH